MNPGIGPSWDHDWKSPEAHTFDQSASRVSSRHSPVAVCHAADESPPPPAGPPPPGPAAPFTWAIGFG